MIEAIPVLAPLAAGLLALSTRRGYSLLSLLGAAVSLAAAVYLSLSASVGGVRVYEMGGWEAPYGIVFVSDALSVLFLLLSSFVFLAVLLDEAGSRDRYFHGLMSLTLAGVNGVFLTGDLFNLFVWFEVTLISSYVLISKSEGSTVASFRYLAMNLLGASFMLVGIGMVYRLTGTLNLAQIARVSSGLPADQLVSPALLLFVAFALKAGAVPLHFWVAEVYSAASSPVAAVLSGAVKKVGIYAVIRLTFFVMPLAGDLLQVAAFTTGVLSIFYGGALAIGQGDLDRLLANSSIAQIGFMLFAVGTGSQAGLRAALALVVGHGLAKALLYLVSGRLAERFGSGELEAMGGAVSADPVLGAAFLAGGVSLIGLPPTAGFLGKLEVLRASLNPTWYLLVTISGSLLTVLYVSRAWSEIFWGEQSAGAGGDGGRVTISVALLFAALLIVGVGFQWVYVLIEAVVGGALDPTAYANGVLGGGIL